MGSREDSYGVGSPSWLRGWSLCPQPCAGAAILDQALLSRAEGLLQVQGQQQPSGSLSG